MAFPWAALISAGTKIGAGILGKKSQDKANKIAIANAQSNRELQREFAQNAIQWKVADAKKAGVHPYYALGAATTSFSPVSVGVSGRDPLADSLADMGQDLSRAVHSTRTKAGRQTAVGATMERLGLERAGLENDLLRAQIRATVARTTANQVGPPGPTTDPNAFLIPGSADGPLAKGKSLDVTRASASQPHSEGGAVTDIGYARTATGYAPVPSRDVKERIEDQFIPELAWALRNQLLPNIGVNLSPPPFKAPKGKRWVYNPLKQEYQLLRRGHAWEVLNRPIWR